MHPEVLHIYGPMSIQWYGLMIFIGIVLFTYAFLKDPQRKKIVTTDQFFDLMTLGIISGIIGGRFLFVLTNRHEITSFYDSIAIWDGGFSILGSVLGILVALPFYLRAKKINILGFLVCPVVAINFEDRLFFGRLLLRISNVSLLGCAQFCRDWWVCPSDPVIQYVHTFFNISYYARSGESAP